MGWGIPHHTLKVFVELLKALYHNAVGQKAFLWLCTKRETRATSRHDTWSIRLGLFLLCCTRDRPGPCGFKCSHFCRQMVFSFLGSHIPSSIPFIFSLKIYPFLLTFWGTSFLLFFPYAWRVTCWHHKVVCGRRMSHHGVWCDHLVTSSSFLLLQGQVQQATWPLSGSSFTASLFLHWSWLSAPASWEHRTQGWVLQANYALKYLGRRASTPGACDLLLMGSIWNVNGMSPW